MSVSKPQSYKRKNVACPLCGMTRRETRADGMLAAPLSSSHECKVNYEPFISSSNPVFTSASKVISLREIIDSKLPHQGQRNIYGPSKYHMRHKKQRQWNEKLTLFGRQSCFNDGKTILLLRDSHLFFMSALLGIKLLRYLKYKSWWKEIHVILVKGFPHLVSERLTLTHASPVWVFRKFQTYHNLLGKKLYINPIYM